MTLSFAMAACTIPALWAKADGATGASNGVTMYRLYNPNSGEHFYTSNSTEKDNLVTTGWSDEGIGWIAPEKSDTPVYRLYNANAGDHHYTMDAKERDGLITAGWKDEGIGWYSDDDKTVPLYREYNPNAVTGTHNYTTDKAEHMNLVKAGWKDEGIGWYAIGDGKSDPPKKPGDPTLKIGDTVILGTYEQDSDDSNGPEEIDWIVIDKNEGKTLLLSRYALDARAYNDTFVPITWENCTLRSWLNNDFCNSAFSTEEQELIFQNVNENADSFDFYPQEEDEGGAEGGNDTEDRVFLLSIHEVQQFFGATLTYSTNNKNDLLICYPTKQALMSGAGGVSVDEYNRYWRGDGYSKKIIGAKLWWLRSPGGGQYYSTLVYKDGKLDDRRLKHVFGDDSSNIAIRPAIYLEY